MVTPEEIVDQINSLATQRDELLNTYKTLISDPDLSSLLKKRDLLLKEIKALNEAISKAK